VQTFFLVLVTEILQLMCYLQNVASMCCMHPLDHSPIYSSIKMGVQKCKGEKVPLFSVFFQMVSLILIKTVFNMTLW